MNIKNEEFFKDPQDSPINDYVTGRQAATETFDYLNKSLIVHLGFTNFDLDLES